MSISIHWRAGESSTSTVSEVVRVVNGTDGSEDVMPFKSAPHPVPSVTGGPETNSSTLPSAFSWEA